LGLCLARSGKLIEATDEARQAIHHAPDAGFCHYALSSILEDRNRFDEAELSIREAIRLEPWHPGYFAMAASIAFQQRDWALALQRAEAGLDLDAEHAGCLNVRAMALTKLGRHAEASETIDSTLARNPESAVSHANQGWTLLHRGEPRRALEH